MNKPAKENKKIALLLLLSVSGILSVFLFQPIAQDPVYHHFADSRQYAGIPNFWNVISNFPFVVVGILALYCLVKRKPQGMFQELFINKLTFFLGIFLTGIGSSYYHLHPANETLLWDRLPMTISFMAFFSIIIGEMISLKAGKAFLVPLLVIGIVSVLYWHITEGKGRGDLRLYGLVQFLPMLLTPPNYATF